jgi:hypothetical protein
MMRSQLLSIILLTSAVSAQVKDGQLIPGLDRPVPDPTLDACFKETALMFDNQAIRNEIIRVDDQYIGRPYTDFCSMSEDGVFVCQVDWSKFNSNLSQICTANGGAYQESAHVIKCRASASDSNGGFVFEHSNLPDCFGQDCEKADIERLLANTVMSMELGYETSLKLPCFSEYDIEDPNLDQEMEQDMEDQEMEQDMQSEMHDQVGMAVDSGPSTTLCKLASLLPALLLLLLA